MARRTHAGGMEITDRAPPPTPQEIAKQILDAPPEHLFSTMEKLIGEHIREKARNEHGEPDPTLAGMWKSEMDLAATTHRIFRTRAAQMGWGIRDFYLGRAEAARGALIALVASILTDL